jgi:hypothetical protein
MMSTDEKLISATRFFRIADDGVPPANQSTSKKLPNHNETNMVSVRTLAALQKKKDEAAAAKAAEGIQQETLATEDMTDVTDEITNSQKEAVRTKRKHNDESGTVNAQTEELTTVTHMGAVGPQIPTMGIITNAQQSLTVADMSTQSMADSLAANRFIEQASSIQQGALPPQSGEGSSATSGPGVSMISSEGDSSDTGYGTAHSGNNSSSHSDTVVTGDTKKRRKLGIGSFQTQSPQHSTQRWTCRANV